MDLQVDSEKNFYYLEMNTRLQVEHPVTEMVVGRDLVHMQIRVAAGEKLTFSQDEVTMRGAAIECRIYAEDPSNGFLPSPGRISKLITPSGPGVRDDSGVYTGWNVPVYYDSLLAKLCVWAETREEAIDRLSRALGEYTIEGIRTTLPFFRAVVASSDFRAGRLDTGFIDRFWNGESREKRAADEQVDVELADVAAIAALLADRDSRADSRQPVEDAWPDASKERMSRRL